MSRELIDKLQKRLDEIIKSDGFQELADGFEQAMKIVEEHFKEDSKEQKLMDKYPEPGSAVFDKERGDYGYVASSGKGGFRIAFPGGSFANFWGLEGLENFKKTYDVV
jgi:hypothetical protein